jgi:hypothetical protein
MKLDELLETRAVAGERYASATGELHDALIELAAIDSALASSSSGHHELPVRTFFNLPQNLANLQHPIFAPANTVTCWRDEIAVRSNALLAAMEISR